MIQGSKGSPNRHLEVQVCIFIDDGKRFQAVDVIYFRSKTSNVGGVGGEWVPGSATSEIFQQLFTPFRMSFWRRFFKVPPGGFLRGFSLHLGAFWKTFRHFLEVSEVLLDGTHSRAETYILLFWEVPSRTRPSTFPGVDFRNCFSSFLCDFL